MRECVHVLLEGVTLKLETQRHAQREEMYREYKKAMGPTP